MNSMKYLGRTLAICAVVSLSACADMGLTRSQRDTAIGAGVGAVAGSALLGGPVGTIGGAAVGGLIGHEVGKR
jgi:osmotically inducible lipoprotein OsmB